MKATGAANGVSRYLEPFTGPAWSWVTAGTVTITYFLAARLGLALLSEPTDVAVFWPAAGVAAGILITFGRRVRPALVIGVMVGTIAANLISDRSLWTSTFKGFCNAGEAVIAAWLLERWFDRPFTFGDLRRVLGFVAAALIAAAASAIGGAVTMTLFHTAAPFWEVWRAWFLSDGVGILIVAPLIIGLGQIRSELPSRAELIEGAGVLALLTLISLHVVTHPTGSWLSFNPGAVVLPLLLWLTARCQPTFAIAGAFVASVTVIYATTFGLGRFGDGGVPIPERVKGAQVAITMMTLYTLVLAALFAQHKKADEGNRESEERLRLAQLRTGVGIWDLNLRTGKLVWTPELEAIFGLEPGSVKCYADFRDRVHPEDIQGIEARRNAALRSRETYTVEFRIIRPDGQVRWMSATGGAFYDEATGEPTRVLGNNADITERKLAELALAERNTQLGLASNAARVGTYTIQFTTGLINLSPGCATILGLPESTVVIPRATTRKLVHLEDLAQFDALCDQAFLQKQREFIAQFRIFRADDGEIRWIEARSLIFYNEGGQPLRLIAVIIDITGRKLAEQELAERNAQIALTGRAALVGSFAFDVRAERTQVSQGYAAIHGLPEGTTEITRSQWRTRLHPEDVERMRAFESEAFRERRRECNVEYRIVRSDGTVRWIESRTFISYESDGHPQRVVGVNIDVTERRRTEQVLADRNRQLELAAKHALVGRFATEMDVAQGDIKSQRAQVSPGFAAIYGLPEETVEISVGDWRSLVHPDDLPQFLEDSQKVFAERRGEHHAEFRIVRPCGSIRWIEARSFIEYDQAGHARRLVGVNIDITERKRAEEARKILNAELDHRVKNVLATVCAIIFQSQHTNASPADFVASVDHRIKSLASTHELLSHSRWHGVSLLEIVRRECEPYSTDNTNISGPSITLKPEAAQATAMVLHELATNAAKYGALSNHSGRVSVRWFWMPNGTQYQRLAIEWHETGGPPVSAPSAFGYGTSIIRELIPHELGGMVDLAFARSGLRCRLEVPADWISRLAREPGAMGETV